MKITDLKNAPIGDEKNPSTIDFILYCLMIFSGGALMYYGNEPALPDWIQCIYLAIGFILCATAMITSD